MAKNSNFNLNDLSSWGLPVTGFFSIIIIAAICFGAQKVFVEDVTKKVRGVDTEIKKQEAQYAKDKKFVALLPKVRDEVSKLQIVRDEAKKYLPTEVSMPALIDNVYLAARDNGIVFQDFKPKADIETDYYTVKPISLRAQVGYVSMSSFIEKITTLKRIMNVQSVSFEKPKLVYDKEKGISNEANPNLPLSMTAELQTYIFKENPELHSD